MATRQISESAAAISSTTTASSTLNHPLVCSVDAVSDTTSVVAYCQSNISIESDLPALALDNIAIFRTVDFAAALPDLQFSGAFAETFHVDAGLPALKFSGSFGFEMILASDLPVLSFAGIGNFTMPGSYLPCLEFSGEMKHKLQVDISGKLPVLGFIGSFGGQPSAEWLLPTLFFAGSVTREADSEGNISGNLPALVRVDSFVYHDEQDINIAGSLPPLSFSGEMKHQITGVLLGNLPPLVGDFVMESVADYGGNLAGKIPVLSFSGRIVGDYYFNIAGMLPALTAPPSGFIGSGGPALTIPDTTRTSDDVIRHRRN